jgi:ribosomal protein S18 acetylase RimI-like enzyme
MAPVGAAWLRRFTEDETDLPVFVAPDVPELAIAILPDSVGKGTGSVLLSRLLGQADRSGIPAIVLSARADNRAIRPYERYGFVETDRIVNRVGMESVKMVRQKLI